MINILLLLLLIAIPVFGDLADSVSVDALGSQTYTGKTTTSEIAVPAEAQFIRVDIDRKLLLDETAHIIVSFEISFDSGKTWRGLAGFETVGGVVPDQDGKDAETSYFEMGLEGIKNPNRLVRGNMTVNKVSTIGFMRVTFK